MNKILVYFEPTAQIDKLSEFTIALARQYNSRIFALTIIKPPVTHLENKANEEKAWKRLYEFEEDAFQYGIKISLLLEELDTINQKTVTEKIIETASAFQIDLLIINNNAKVSLKKLVRSLTIPTIIIPLKTIKDKERKD
ncbi:MAG: universal stress protein [candidate division WOR-3 bacterium]|nr:universal stress protein [candidate division WOR-3 bacterium]